MDELQLPEGTISESHSVDSQGRRHVQITITPSNGEIKPNNRPSPGSMGNTTGIILPVTSPEAQRAQMEVQPETAEEESWWGSWGGTVHLGLDLIGMVPVLGEVADLANAAIYAAEGDTVNALMSLASAAPGAGNAVTAAKWGKRGMEAVDTAADATQAVKAAKGTKAAKAADAPKPKAGGGGPKPPKKTGGKSKGKKKMKCGEYGKYGDLKKKTGDGKFDRDHIPSKAALKERALELKQAAKGSKARLTKAQKDAIDKWGNSIAIPRQAHIDVSPTHGRKNIKLAPQDAKDLAGSARRDVEAMLKKIDEYDADGGCKKAYQKASKKVLRMSNKDYDKTLVDILRSVE